MSSNALLNPVFLDAVYVAVNLQDILFGTLLADSGRVLVPNAAHPSYLRFLWPGVVLVIYVETINTLLMLERKGRADIFHTLFSTIMLILVTVMVSSNAVLGEEVCKSHSNYPGGPAAYWASNPTHWYMISERAAILILQLVSDALLVRPCHGVVLWT